MSPLSTTVNVNYSISTMKKFLKALGQKGPDLVPREWIFSGITTQFTLPGKLSRSRLKKNSSSFTNLLSLFDLAQGGYIPFLKLKRELAASPCPPGRGHEEVRGGHLHSDQRQLPQGTQEIARGLRKVCPYWQWICQKKLEKTFFDNFYHFCFICLLHFVLEFTSYVTLKGQPRKKTMLI
jgi:hypothetical protein